MSAHDFAVLDDLMRLVLRAFYTNENYVVAEILLKEHRAIADEELAAILKLNIKQVRKYLSRIKDDHLLQSLTKKDERINPETGEVIPGRKWSQQTFYYVDYKHFVDVVKYRIMKMQAKVNEEGSIDVQTYSCPRCRRKYSALDAPSLIDPVTGLFLCERCKAQVKEDDNTEVVSATQSRSTKMNEQLKPIIEQLKKTEGMTIPEISIARLTAREEISTGEEEGSRSRPVSFLEKQQKVQVSLHSADDPMPSGVTIAGSKAEPAAVVKVEAITEKKELPPWLVKGGQETETEEKELPQMDLEVQAKEIKEDEETSEYLRKYKQQMDVSTSEFEMEQTTTTSEEEVMIQIGDRLVPLSQVTDEDKDKMTPTEFAEYAEKSSSAHSYYDDFI